MGLAQTVMTPFDKLLNAEQLAAATAADGPLLVLAAAGTGKTRTLVYRVACLVERGVPPSALLLLTFTNRAAREMLERAQEVAGAVVGQVWSGTFHHICHRFLRRHATRLKYPNAFLILDRDDARSVIDDCVQGLKLKHRDFPRREVLNSLFSNAANRVLPIEDVIDENLSELAVDPMDIVRVHEAYQIAKAKLGLMDFDDLLVNGLRLLDEHPDICRSYQEQFRHILVDEYQDTNLLQSRFVDALGVLHRNVMAVGDDFQCIYTWRGADFRNIMEFPKRYPDAQIVKLEQNYRSVPEVLAVANACIAGNPEQFQKTLRPTRPPRNRPRVFYLRDGQEQADVVVELMRRYRADGCALRDMAVLYRAHFHSIELQVALSRAGLPHQVVSGVGVFEQAHVKDVLAFLRVAENPNDRLAFDRLLGMLYGLGPRSTATYWQKLGSAFDCRDERQRQKLLDLVKPAARVEWAAIDALLGDYHARNWGANGAEAIDRFQEAFYAHHLARTYENADNRLEDLRELALQIGRSSSVAAFLSEVALWTNVDHEFDKDRTVHPEAVRLSTVHQAKGLEWPVVFVLWAAEGMFPSSRSMGESGNEAEERRLFYVAVTRARDELCILAPEWRRTRDGGAFYCKPSRFVTEIPAPLVRSVYGTRF